MLYLSEGLSEYRIHKLRDAGSKARIDVEAIVSEKYRKIATVVELRHQNNSFLEKVFFMLRPASLGFMIKMIFSKERDLAFIQYPFYDFNFVFQDVIKNFIKRHKVILLIHDINSLRGELSIEKIDAEIALFNRAKAIIVHNSKMRDALLENGLKVPCVLLDLFDYCLYDGIPNRHREFGNTIVFAGNLEKSSFLGELYKIGGVHFNLYGNGFAKAWEKNPNFSYFGSYPSDEIPYQLKGSFGLVWDGQSIYTCDDNIVGRYTRINNPHKLSLYIAAGLPVIVWKQAAIAAFVEREKIGFAVESLVDIPEMLERVQGEEYNRYIENIRALQVKVTNGDYTNRALEEAIEIAR